MAPNVSFDTQLLTQAQTAMDVANAECAQLQQAMNQFNADLMAGWGGGASKTFNGVFTEFLAAYAKVNGGLKQMQGNLNSAAKTLGVNEQTVQSQASSIGSQLNGQINAAVHS